jgi:hypothetical protein
VYDLAAVSPVLQTKELGHLAHLLWSSGGKFPISERTRAIPRAYHTQGRG